MENTNDPKKLVEEAKDATGESKPRMVIAKHEAGVLPDIPKDFPFIVVLDDKMVPAFVNGHNITKMAGGI